MPVSLLSQAQSSAVIAPMAILALCVLGAVGVGLLLPADRTATARRLGGAIAAGAALVLGVLLLRQADQLRITGPVGAYFWAFAAIAIIAAVRVITHPRPVYSALYFVLTVFASAGLFVLLSAQFMAAALVLIYAGAVLVTYVFVIMLAAESTGAVGATGEARYAAVAEVDRVSRDPFLAGAIGFALLGVLMMVIFDRTAGTPGPTNTSVATTAPVPATTAAVPGTTVATESPTDDGLSTAPRPSDLVLSSDTQLIGTYLYRRQVVAVQVAMLLLTLAMTGAVIIARRRVYLGPATKSRTGALTTDVLIGPATPTDDNPHTIPVFGTQDPRAKQYPQI